MVRQAHHERVSRDFAIVLKALHRYWRACSPVRGDRCLTGQDQRSLQVQSEP